MPVIDEVRNILTTALHLDLRGNQLLPETNLLGSLPELDSMGVINVITGLEERFGFAIADDEISADAFETFGSLVAFVEQKLEQ
jgi:acyl carrier protein